MQSYANRQTKDFWPRIAGEMFQSNRSGLPLAVSSSISAGSLYNFGVVGVVLYLLCMFGSIPSPASDGFEVGPFFLHAYGLSYVVAIVAAMAIGVRRWEAKGGSRDLVSPVALWAIPAGLVGARLYFVLTSWDRVPSQWWGPFAIWTGGLGVWGGIAAGAAVGIWVLHREGANIPLFMDAGAPALLVAQGIGRIGNWFNQELFGGPTSLPWALEIDPFNRPDGYELATTFHPTFLYELIWNFSLAGALVWLGHHRKIRPPGLFALYVAGYSFFRIFEEMLRIDPSHHFFSLRLNFYVAGLLFIAGVAWFIRTQRKSDDIADGTDERQRSVARAQA